MNVRHAYIFEHKHTRAKESCTDSFKGCLDFHPPPLSFVTNTHTYRNTHPPPPSPLSVSLSEWGQRGQFAERPVLLLRGKRWTLRCFDRWSLRANFFSQTMHWYGFTPEWERRCRDSSSDRENLHPQPGHVQAKGFSPVCLLRWALRWLLLVYILLQPGKEHLCILIRSATALFWYLWPPASTPAAEPPPNPPSPSPMGLAAMGTGAIRTNLDEPVLPFLLVLVMFAGESSWGTKAKVCPWMLTRSWAILISDGAWVGGDWVFWGWACWVTASDMALGLGSCLICMGWICKMTGTLEAALVPSVEADGDSQSSCLIPSTPLQEELVLAIQLASTVDDELSMSEAHGVYLVSV